MTNAVIVVPRVRAREWLRWTRGWASGRGHRWELCGTGPEVRCSHCRESPPMLVTGDVHYFRGKWGPSPPPHVLRRLFLYDLPSEDCRTARVREVMES